MAHVRMQIAITTKEELLKFMLAVNGETDVYIVENFTGTYRTAAQSMLGMIDLVTNNGGDLYLVNETVDGAFPGWVEQYRA